MSYCSILVGEQTTERFEYRTVSIERRSFQFSLCLKQLVKSVQLNPLFVPAFWYSRAASTSLVLPVAAT
jgi:hypothetical protein